jgi:hypothetical protein
MGFLSKNAITALRIYTQAYNYMTKVYGQTKNVFTPASPYGQLLTVLSNIGELIFYYIESAISELNFATAKNVASIYGLSRLTGHNPTRAISAIGKIALVPRTDAAQGIQGNYVIIPDKAEIQCADNGLIYLLFLDAATKRVDKTSQETFYFTVKEGTIQTQTFTGTGASMQSFSVITNNPTDHFYYRVRVNGVEYANYESLYDIAPEERGCVVKTGINGGIDVYFGNGNFGRKPPSGSLIEIEYMISRGPIGNLQGNTGATFTFITEGADEFGNTINLNDFFQIFVELAPDFGSAPENPDFTRIIAPHASKSFVLANPDSYVYFLKKYGFFSFVNAYNTKDDQYIDDDNIVYLVLIPDIKAKLTTDFDYFTLPLEEFTLTSVEKDRVYQLLDNSGQMLITAENRIVDIDVNKYAINVVLRYFENADKSQIRSLIRDRLNEYFLNVKRRDRVPRSDLVSLIEQIPGIDSVNVFFVSEQNETAIRNGYYEVEVMGYDPVTKQKALLSTKRINLAPGEDPGLGLDDFGDIKINDNELVVIRGDWYDRNNNYYEEYPNDQRLSSLNVFFKEGIKADLYNQIQNQNFEKLRNRTIVSTSSTTGTNPTTQLGG